LMVGVLTWCEFSEKVDLGSIRSTTDKALSEVNAKVAEMKEKAQAKAQAPATAPEAAPSGAAAATGFTAAGVSSATATPTTAHCPRCSEEVYQDDRFCEHCGHQLG
ncbi:MAG: zinc-ribbon domain-containing protein, partial [Giesbergeria sp.]|nr:zinc-ribbon domain-containing protein [Giesbergeria sp.]